MSRPFVKIVGASILPATTLISSKLVGFFLAAQLLNVQWELSKELITNSFFSVYILVQDRTLQALTNSFSNSIMMSVMCLILIVKIIQRKYLDDENISPRLLTRLAENNLLSLIRSAEDLRYELTMWVVFSWIGLFTVLMNTLLAYSHLSVFTTFLVIVVAITVAAFSVLKS